MQLGTLPRSSEDPFSGLEAAYEAPPMEGQNRGSGTQAAVLMDGPSLTTAPARFSHLLIPDELDAALTFVQGFEPSTFGSDTVVKPTHDT